MKALFAAAALAVSSLALPAAAEVTTVEAGGFQVKTVVEIAAPRADVWKALLQPGRWWNPQHSWSGEAKNLSLEARAGGCFCERWPSGEAMHMLVWFVKPEAELRLWGALGPLSMQGAAGGLSVELQQAGPRSTKATLTYTVGGYLVGGAKTWAPIVDGVLLDQMQRLERAVETGAP